ncbi:MAG: RluA family pseudouridine synthase [Gammaproteobacteria bacterium]
MSLSQHKVQMIEIGPRNAEQRLDNFLLSQLKGIPKSRIYKLLRSGQVRVNMGRKKPSYRLQLGDNVRIPPVTTVEPRQLQAPRALQDKLNERILFENDDFLVVNKPAGLAVHGGSNVLYGLIETLRQSRPNADMLELVHRLDQETSGCLVIAKSRQALGQLHDQFRSDSDMEKIYRAILVGRWQGGEQLIEAPLKKNNLKSGERMVTVDAQGKAARSLFSPLAYYDEASVMEVKLFTGRTHQIRVHAHHVGHPVAGDRKYGDHQYNQTLKDRGLRRMFLHAQRLSFNIDRDYEFIAPMDSEWQQFLSILES